MARALSAAGLPGVRDVVPSYACVGVHVDPLRLDVAALERAVARAWDAGRGAGGDRPSGRDSGDLRRRRTAPTSTRWRRSPGVHADEVVRRHSDAVYRVYMLGFLPGFAYLGAVDERDRDAAARRRRAPAVPPGSVGIAGRQTGVYPVESPGGWRLVGRTPWRMFDADAGSPVAGRGRRSRALRAGGGGGSGRCSARGRRHERGDGLTVVRPGLLTTVQDLGRWGHQADRRAGGRADGHSTRTGWPMRWSAIVTTPPRSR